MINIRFAYLYASKLLAFDMCENLVLFFFISLIKNCITIFSFGSFKRKIGCDINFLLFFQQKGRVTTTICTKCFLEPEVIPRDKPRPGRVETLSFLCISFIFLWPVSLKQMFISLTSYNNKINKITRTFLLHCL